MKKHFTCPKCHERIEFCECNYRKGKSEEESNGRRGKRMTKRNTPRQ